MITTESGLAACYTSSAGRPRVDFQAMFRSLRITGFVVCGLCGLSVLPTQTAVGASPNQGATDVASVSEKIRGIVAYGSEVGDRPAPRETRLSETEVSDFLESAIRVNSGFSEVRVLLEGQGKVIAMAVVDLDQIQRGPSVKRFDPMNFLSGRLPVTVVGALHATKGVGRVEVERVEVSGFPVPKALVMDLIVAQTRSVERPQGVEIERDFTLPYRIQAIQVHSGEVLILQ